MKKFLIIIQFLFTFLLIFFLNLFWLTFIIKTSWIKILITSIISTLLSIFIFFLKNKKQNEYNLKTKEKEDATQMFLSLLKDNSGIIFFENLLKTKYKDIQKYSNYFIIKINNQSILFYCFLKYRKLEIDDISDILLKHKVDKYIFICNDYNENIENSPFHDEKNIIVYNKFETYKYIFKKYEYFPKITIKTIKKDYSIKRIISNIFNKKKTKSYFLSSMIILLTSIIIKPNIYYCIIASILGIFALISFISPFQNNSNKGKSL